MADTSVTANTGTGGNAFAIDLITAVSWPYAKLAWGPSGTVNELDDATGKRIPVKLAESSITLAISGTVTSNIGTTNGLALDATLTGGSAVSIAKGGAKGTTTAAVLTSNPIDANTQALHVDGSKVTQPVSGTVTANAGSGTFTVSGTVTSNIGTTNGLALDATLTGGTAKSIPTPSASGGLTISRTISAASTNATSVKASAGQVYTIYATNTNAAVRFLKLYNKASSPTVGSDTPVMTMAIPGNAAGAGFSFDTGGIGIAFGTGIALAITTGVADADTGSVAANEIVVNLLYK